MLFILLENELGLSYEGFCRFLATFYSASGMGAIASRLLDNKNYNSEGLMLINDYHRLLKCIDQSSTGNDDDSLWIQLEELFNSFTKKNFCRRETMKIFVLRWMMTKNISITQKTVKLLG